MLISFSTNLRTKENINDYFSSNRISTAFAFQFKQLHAPNLNMTFGRLFSECLGLQTLNQMMMWDMVGMFGQVVEIQVMEISGGGNLVAKPEICSRIHLLWFGGNLGEEVEIEYNHMFVNAIASKAKNRRDSGWEEQVGIWMRTDANKEIIYLPFSLDISSEIYQTTFFYYMIYISLNDINLKSIFT